MNINSEQIHLDKPTVLSDLLEHLGYHTNRIAVEHNGRIVPKSDYAAVLLSDDDALEIVSFVGGG